MNVIHSAIALLICVVPVYKAMDEQFFYATGDGAEWRDRLRGTVALYERSGYLRKIRVTAKECNVAKKYGPHAELCFFSLRQMRCETEPGHLSRVALRPAGEAGGARASIERLQRPRGRPWVVSTRGGCTHWGFFFPLTDLLD